MEKIKYSKTRRASLFDKRVKLKKNEIGEMGYTTVRTKSAFELFGCLIVCCGCTTRSILRKYSVKLVKNDNNMCS